jgi:hypothetical protein
MKAIQTTYKGYKFRSRLEARFAVMFEALGLKWQYEPEGYDLGAAGWYLPDFYLPGLDAWVEVKAKPLNAEEREKAFALSSMTNKPVIELCEIPDPDLISKTGCMFANFYYGLDCDDLTVYGLLDFYMEQNNLKEACLKDAIRWDVDYYYEKYGQSHPHHFKTGVIQNKREMFGGAKLYNAAIKARSARFEYGEKP